MRRKLLAITAILIILTTFILVLPVNASLLPQQPTGTIPTVTGTPPGIIGTVKTGMEDKINVRSGPSYFADPIGVLMAGQAVSVKGISPGGDWLVIEYPGVAGGIGWVFANYFQLTPGELPVVEAPPTPLPKTTNTIDPTMAAEFLVTAAPTRLPTFTPPAPLTIPTYTDNSSSEVLAGIPIGLVIVSLAAIGVFLGILALLQGR